MSPLTDASLTFYQRTPTVPVPPGSDPSPTPRDLRASRRSAVVARNSSASTNARASTDASAHVAADIGACIDAGARSSCAGTTAPAVPSKAAGEAVTLLPDARISTDAPVCVAAAIGVSALVRVAAAIGASTDAGTNAGAGAPPGVCSAPGSVPTIQLWIQHAWRHPTWLHVMMELHQFQDTYDLFRHCGSFTHLPSAAPPVALATLSPYIKVNIVKFSPAQQLQFARLAHDISLPLGTPDDVHSKSPWEVPVPSTYRQATTGPHTQASVASKYAAGTR